MRGAATPFEAALVVNVAAGTGVGALGAATARPDEILAHLGHAESPALAYA
jgi:predicted RNA methylase